jgi:hypothetical protein
MWRSQFGTSAFSKRSSVRGRDVSCAQLLVIVLGDTLKLDGFRRLDHLTRAGDSREIRGRSPRLPNHGGYSGRVGTRGGTRVGGQNVPMN